ncbi:flagellin, partial [Acinetobacter sp. AGC35]
NKAADDAAGLAISEKMRAQIRGLAQAERNIQDGISLIQTAEGGLGTIQDPSLLRLRELAVQAANDTLASSDRSKIQDEVERIKQGINDIANNTHFNGVHLLNVTENLFDSLSSTNYIGTNV